MFSKNPARIALRISLAYVVVAGAWILLSDRVVLALWGDSAAVTAVQTYKGWFFVAATGLILFFWIREAARGWAERDAAGVEAQRAQLETQKESEVVARRLEVMLEGGVDGFLLIDREWRYTHVNRAALQLLGKPLNEIVGRVVWEVFPEAVGSTFHTVATRVMTERKPEQFEEQAVRWDKWLEFRMYPAPEGIAIFARDITERKRAEAKLQEASQRLRQSEERLKAAQARAKMGSWESDMTTGENWWSEELCRMFHRDPAAGAAPLGEFLEMLHPDDRGTILDTAAEMPVLRSTKTEKFRSNPALGPVRYFDAIVEAIFDEQGRRIKAGGTIMDVTERR